MLAMELVDARNPIVQFPVSLDAAHHCAGSWVTHTPRNVVAGHEAIKCIKLQ